MRLLRAFRDFIYTQKGMRRILAFSWMGIICFATVMTFTNPEIAQLTSVQYQLLLGAGAAVNLYYYKSRKDETFSEFHGDNPEH